MTATLPRTRSVWVSEATSGLGRRVATLVAAAERLVPGEATTSDVIVWLSSTDADTRSRHRQSATHGGAAALAGAAGARHVVLVSSAMVYGAWANNPVPLTEDALLRPDVEFTYARQLGSVEQLADEWRLARPDRTVPVLRPATAMAADGTSGLVNALVAGMGQRRGEEDPPG